MFCSYGTFRLICFREIIFSKKLPISILYEYNIFLPKVWEKAFHMTAQLFLELILDCRNDTFTNRLTQC